MIMHPPCSHTTTCPCFIQHEGEHRDHVPARTHTRTCIHANHPHVHASRPSTGHLTRTHASGATNAHACIRGVRRRHNSSEIAPRLPSPPPRAPPSSPVRGSSPRHPLIMPDGPTPAPRLPVRVRVRVCVRAHASSMLLRGEWAWLPRPLAGSRARERAPRDGIRPWA